MAKIASTSATPSVAMEKSLPQMVTGPLAEMTGQALGLQRRLTESTSHATVEC